MHLYSWYLKYLGAEVQIIVQMKLNPLNVYIFFRISLKQVLILEGLIQA